MEPTTSPDRYRRAWMWVWRVVVAVGLAAAILIQHVEELLAAFAVGGLLGASAAAIVSSARPEALRARPLLAAAAWGGTGLAAAIAVAELHPLVSLGLLAMAALSSPLVAKQGAASHRATHVRSTRSFWHRELLASPERVVATLETSTLCEIWRDTRTWLAQESAASGKASVVALRAALIDELERRCPERAAAWLHAEGVAPSDPAKFLG